MSSPASPRNTALPERRLGLYGVAAGAALAAAASANANLITLDLRGLGASSRTTPTNGSLYFDVNASSAAAAVGFSNFAGADFSLYNTSGPFPSAGITGVGGTNGVAGKAVVLNKAGNFTTSESVGPMNNFFTSAKVAGGATTFNPGDSGNLGLRFDIGGSTHYGWANILVNSDFTVTLNELAYQDVANAPAHVEPSAPMSGVPDSGSSLALLALGAAGLATFRARQRQTA